MDVKLKKLSEQVVVITGASSGIGLVTAREAARRGARLVVAARAEEALRRLAEEINSQGGEAVYVAADVGRQDDVRRIAETALERFGRIDTWVNNAGVSIYGRIMDTPFEDIAGSSRRTSGAWSTARSSRPSTCASAAARSSTSAASSPTAQYPCRASTAPRSTRSRASRTPCAWNSKRRAPPSPSRSSSPRP